MKRFYVFLLCTIVLVCFEGAAQNSPAAGAEKGQPAAEKDKTKTQGRKPRAGKEPVYKKGGTGKKGEQEAAPSKPESTGVEIKGDTVILKSGAQLRGVQVLSRTASEVEVDVGAGVRVTIPRRQIQDIKYDDIEPRRGSQGVDASSQKADIFPGNKLKPEVSEKLTAPMKEPVKYENVDLVKVLAELSQRFGVTIIVDDPVKSLPENERLWTLETKPDANLTGVLQDEFLRKFPALAVVYQYDKLLVTTKERAAALTAQEPSQAPTPPLEAGTPRPAPPQAPAVPAMPTAPAPQAPPPASPEPPAVPAALAPQAPLPVPPQPPAVPAAPTAPAPQTNPPAPAQPPAP